jgi:hypothetical protein
MAYTATREAIDGGDLDTWAQYQQAHDRLSIGLCTADLFISGGAAYMRKGKIGLYNGTTRYVIDNSADASISVAGLTASRWAQVEVSVVAGAVVVEVASMGSEVERLVTPSTFLAAYDGSKGGHYLSTTKRCIGLLWVDSTGAVANIINPVANERAWSLYYPEHDVVTGAGDTTLKLPLAASCKKGEKVRVRLSEDSGAGLALIGPNTGDTLVARDGSSLAYFYLRYFADWAEFASDGASEWRVCDFNYESTWQSTTTAWSASTTPPTKGTVVSDVIKFQRRGNLLFCDGKYMQSAAGSAGNGTYRLTIPWALTLDTSEIVGYGDTTSYKERGIATLTNQAAEVAPTTYAGRICVTTDGYLIFRFWNPTASGDQLNLWTHASAVNFGSTVLRIDFKFDLPIEQFAQYL